MTYLPSALRDLIGELATAPLWLLWAQCCAVAFAIALGIAVRMFLPRLRSFRRQEKNSPLPFGALISTLVLWVAYAAFVQYGLAAGPLRVAAILCSAWAAAKFALRFIGGTALGRAAVLVIVLIAILEVIGLARPLAAILDSGGVQFGSVRFTVWLALKSLVVVAGLLWAAQRVGDLVDHALADERVLSRSGKVLAGKLARVGLFAVAIFLSLGFLGFDITTLAVLSGAIGLGLGFGLQKVVSNYVSGLILLFDRSIKPGDVIEVEFGSDKLRGEVTELAGRYTAITLRTGVETLIPNEVLISNPVSNWSHTSRNVQIRIPVGVAYSSDVERAMALCIDAASSVKRVLSAPKPACLIVGFGDSAVDLEVRFWISDAESGVRNVSSEVYLAIWKRFHENNVEIPFPQRDLHVRSWPKRAD